MRVAGPLLVALLLAGCALGPAPPQDGAGEAPSPSPASSSRPPAGIPPGECLSLTLDARPPVFAVGQRASIVATVSNCGGSDYVLMKPGRCSIGRSLVAGIEDGNRTYWLFGREDPPVDGAFFATAHGPCGVGDPTLAVLPPLGRHGVELRWNGTVSRAVRDVEESPGVTSIRTTTVPAKLAPGPHRVFLTLQSADGTREWTVDRTVHVAATRDNPDPHVAPKPGMSLWLPTPPPADPPPRPATPEEFARRNAQRGPAEAPQAVTEAGRGLLRHWTGASADNYTLSHVTHQPMEAFCSAGSERCDAWGWLDYYVLQYDVRFPGVEGNASFTLSFPVRSDGVVVDEDVQGVPDCVRDPAECVVTVDAWDALRRAREEGLGNGTRPWRVQFTWHREHEWIPADVTAGVGVPPRVHGTFAWSVRNSTGEDDAGGDVVVIDANDGRLVGRDQWSRGWW